jgi:hypothetical protein
LYVGKFDGIGEAFQNIGFQKNFSATEKLRNGVFVLGFIPVIKRYVTGSKNAVIVAAKKSS